MKRSKKAKHRYGSKSGAEDCPWTWTGYRAWSRSYSSYGYDTLYDSSLTYKLCRSSASGVYNVNRSWCGSKSN